LAQEELAELGRKAEGVLRELARDRHPMVRLRAGYAMGLSKEKRFLGDMLRLLSDPVQMVRYDTGYALGHLGQKSAMSYMLRENRIACGYNFESRQRGRGVGFKFGFGGWRSISGSGYGLVHLGGLAIPSLQSLLSSHQTADLEIAFYALRQLDPEYFGSLKARFQKHPKVGWYYRDQLSCLSWSDDLEKRTRVATPMTRFGKRRRPPKPQPFTW
jgi:hypothetical protein